MKKIIIINLIFIGGFILNSCNNDDFINSSIDAVPKLNQTNKLNFTYQGRAYSSTYNQINDSVKVLDDPQINSLYQEINRLPNLFSLTDEKGNVEFYDDIYFYWKYSGINNINIGNQRIVSDDSTLGSMNELKLSGGGGLSKFLMRTSISIPDLSAFNMDNSIWIISVYMTNPFTVVIFHDKDYGGKAKGYRVDTPNQAGSYTLYADLIGERDWMHRETSSIRVFMDSGRR